MEQKFIARHGLDREIIVEPKNSNIEYSLIWMHGLGDSAHGFMPIFASEDTFAPDNFKIRLLTAPEAAVTINMGMVCNSWFDIMSLERTDTSYNFEDIQNNSKKVQQVIKEEVQALGGDPSKVFIGGFSQGCAMALHNGLIFDGGVLGGIIGLSGYLFHQTTIPTILPPVLLSHGEYDRVIDIKYAVDSYKREEFSSKAGVEFHK